jgi:hypothetical protein
MKLGLHFLEIRLFTSTIVLAYWSKCSRQDLEGSIKIPVCEEVRRCPPVERWKWYATRFGSSENAKRDDGTVDTGAATVLALLAHDPSTWDYVVMNDYTQAPARTETRLETIQALDRLRRPLVGVFDSHSTSDSSVSGGSEW